ncbi:hypothetical protein [Actinacidiphila sp. bgisy160]|uniref:hypothetical protein n=1 Tax=Actinacidiphila sp. bgisy160 TaxID=3413796 RepID=UPI003D72760F
MSAACAASAAAVRTGAAVRTTAVARRAALMTVLGALAFLAVCGAGKAGVPDALGVPGPALAGALLPAAGVGGVLYAVRPR